MKNARKSFISLLLFATGYLANDDANKVRDVSTHKKQNDKKTVK